LPKLLGDANPGAQEKVIDAFKVYLEKRNGSGIDGKSVLKNPIDKALAPGKPNIKKVTLEVICLMFEHMEKKEIMEGVVDSINHKNQKVSCAGVQALVELLTNYGPRKLNFLKPFFSAVEKLAASTVSSQRTEAISFYKEAYKYMGEALKPFIVNLKKAQLDELEKFFTECLSELAKPAKADASEVEMGGTGNGGAARRGSGALDVYEIADAVDLLKKFNDEWSEKVLAKEKWSEKKTMLEELLKEASATPKIAANGHFSHMTNMLKKILGHSNQQVMLTGIKIYGALARGLRRNLANGCKNIMPAILAKLKDKKNVVEETMRTMDNFLYFIDPEDVLEDLQVVFNDKAPIAKV
jgi:cytoskeleton-associated protein 5